MFTKNVLTSSIQGAGFEMEYLVIAGGGSGGYGYGGGGGAGGYRSSVAGEDSGGGASAESTLVANLGVAYTVTIGAGGAAAGGAAQVPGNDGSTSVFSTISTTGGGGGGYNSVAGRPGGSGGGGGGNAITAGGTGTANEGFAGGPSAGGLSCGGGGGASQIGGTNGTGQGGDGVSSAINGTNTYRAGGGGGYIGSVTAAAGGLGGGGDGSTAASQAGEANTGGGGAGYTGASGTSTSGAGGSGVVIIKLPRKIIAEFSAGVAYNYIPVDGFHVYEITAAGASDTVTFRDGSDTPVTIDESLRFNDDDNAELTRTPSASGNRRTWTYSAWVKTTIWTAEADTLFCAANSQTDRVWLFIRSGSTGTNPRAIDLVLQDSGGAARQLTSTAVFRDPSAWYHIVLSVDTTQATDSDRVKLYVNGLRITDFNTANYPVLNEQFPANQSGAEHLINGIQWTVAYNGDMYLSDVYFIDGQALDPSNFGHADDNGVWQPIAYPGTYGTNGFHLEFADNSTAAALGTDTSGNGNNFTPSGITTDDQMADTPSANHCTWNPLDWNITYLADGNLRAYNTLTAWQMGRANFGITTGKWYWEAYSPTTYTMVGIALATQSLGTYFGQGAASWGYYNYNGSLYRDNSSFAYGATWGASDVIGVAFDADTGQLTFYKNGVSQGLAVTVTTGQTYFPAVAVYNSGITHNFGQRPFTYTPPTGFAALSSANLPTPTIADGKEHFDIALYTGDGGSQNVRGFEFQPDFAWVKERTTTEWNQLYDALRGTGALFSNDTSAELTLSGISFLSNGFTASDTFRTNQRGLTYVGWAWNAGGSTVTNTDGTVSAQLRANPDAGFSIATFTAPGAYGNYTVGHGLSKAPEVIIIKERNRASNWLVYHKDVTNYQAVLRLNLSDAVVNTGADMWGNAEPTSTVWGFNLQGILLVNAPTIAYCFAGVDGFSKFGTYVGNGSANGPFIYTGFRPAWVMVKASSVNGEQWAIMDSKRSGYNVINNYLNANRNVAEYSYGGGGADILSNGFKLRSTSTGLNGSGITFIYMAFAENPFKTARAR